VGASRNGRIGVIGTAGTMKSDAYARAIRALAPAALVVQRACPLFVPLVEEGWLDHPATRLIAGEYLAPVVERDIDVLVLGCTHYPLLKPLLHDVLGPGITLIDSAEETARAVAAELDASGRANDPGGRGDVRFVVSDAPEQFERVGAAFLGERVKDVETVVLGG
jgi:glutamate racemase